MPDRKVGQRGGPATQLLSDLVIGGSVGAVAKTIMAPVERIKLLLQTMDSNPDVISGKVERYKGVVDCFHRVKADQGLGSFWRGNLVNCLRSQLGLAMAFNDFINDAFPTYDPKREFWHSFAVKLISGGIAGAVASAFFYPFDYARTRLASDITKGQGQFSGVVDCISTTVRKQGIAGLCSGLPVTAAGGFMYRAGQLGCFKQIQAVNPYRTDKGELGGISSFISAIFAVTAVRTVAMPLNYPFDTVRRRMMLQSDKPMAERLYKGSLDCFFKVLKAEGFGGMYKGLVPELFKGFGGSVVIVGYDRIKVIYNL
jgi:solute carrier family 25 (adenine nucleotide translocator) protein 4/5/6/31